MGTLERLRKRNSYPVNPDEPDGIKVRALRLDEVARMNVLEPEQKTAFILGCGLLEDNGEQVYPQAEMSDVDFAKHILASAQIGMDQLAPIVAAINRVSTPQDPATIAKN